LTGFRQYRIRFVYVGYEKHNKSAGQKQALKHICPFGKEIMSPVDYYKIIHTLIPPSSKSFRFFLPHAILVTQRALAAGRLLGLEESSLRFIEEASMLHDIGIVRVQAEEIGCTGSLPYLAHGPEGRAILEELGYPRHALVCERHLGTGLSREEIIHNQLPLPHRDMIPESLEEEIICWADLYFSKSPNKLWIEKSAEKVRKKVAKYGTHHLQRFEGWQARFTPFREVA
jgi:uncharacterized protein